MSLSYFFLITTNVKNWYSLSAFRDEKVSKVFLKKLYSKSNFDLNNTKKIEKIQQIIGIEVCDLLVVQFQGHDYPSNLFWDSWFFFFFSVLSDLKK